MAATLDRRFGREAFGADPAGYHAARPAYPEALYETLRERAGLAQGARILEIGAGTGTATAALLAHRPSRLTAVEPDLRSAAFLRAAAPDPPLDVVAQPFAEVDLVPSSFDLACCATAFHWLEADAALAQIHAALRPGGATALWWNVFGDDSRPDPFHEATLPLFADQRPSPSAGDGRTPYALATAARLADLRQAGFTPVAPPPWRWTLTLDAGGVRALYATYSNVAAMAPEARERLLHGLSEIAERRFGGRVERNMTTVLYIGCKAN